VLIDPFEGRAVGLARTPTRDLATPDPVKSLTKPALYFAAVAVRHVRAWRRGTMPRSGAGAAVVTCAATALASLATASMITVPLEGDITNQNYYYLHLVSAYDVHAQCMHAPVVDLI
jgi:hypothetical protein